MKTIIILVFTYRFQPCSIRARQNRDMFPSRPQGPQLPSSSARRVVLLSTASRPRRGTSHRRRVACLSSSSPPACLAVSGCRPPSPKTFGSRVNREHEPSTHPVPSPAFPRPRLHQLLSRQWKEKPRARKGGAHLRPARVPVPRSAT